MPTECPAHTVIAVVTRKTRHPVQLGFQRIARTPPVSMTKTQSDFAASQRMLPCTAFVWRLGLTRSVECRFILITRFSAITLLD